MSRFLTIYTVTLCHRYPLGSRAKTNIPNIRIFVRNNQTNIRLNLNSIRVNNSHIFWKFMILFKKWWNFHHKIDYYELNYDWNSLCILRLLRVTGNIYWFFSINFDKWGVNAYSSKRTNIRIFVRLVKGSFVTFRIFVSALLGSVHNVWTDISEMVPVKSDRSRYLSMCSMNCNYFTPDTHQLIRKPPIWSLQMRFRSIADPREPWLSDHQWSRSLLASLPSSVYGCRVC